MYARAGHCTLLSVIYHRNTTHCLQYRRHMRSRTAGHFVLFYQRTDMLNVPPSYVTLSDTTPLFKVSGNRLDIWLFYCVILLWQALCWVVWVRVMWVWKRVLCCCNATHVTGTRTESRFLLEDTSSASMLQHVLVPCQLLLQLTMSYCWKVLAMFKVTQLSAVFMNVGLRVQHTLYQPISNIAVTL